MEDIEATSPTEFCYQRLKDQIIGELAVLGSFERLKELKQLVTLLDASIEDEVTCARAEGATWDMIAMSLGMARSVAHYRYGRKRADGQED